MSAVHLVRSDALAAVPYAYASRVEPGAELIFLAGACPLADDGSTVAVGDVAGQARRCVENMLVALDAAGAGTVDVASTRVLVASSERRDLVAAWEVVRAAFGEHDVPSTLMGVAALGYAHQLVEVEVVAAVRRG
ncbi:MULTISPECIES: RidA family protein [unclassified Microbacterium]|uniref:RidA family protein n=1 Tax=unclassified Microbacterium TaxID=2609290 RepID=UPI003C2C8E7C